MCILSFKKYTDKQNLLFDEFFLEYDQIDILGLNYDGKGSALCRCDGQLTTIDSQRLAKVLFGVHRTSLENYLQSIFDPTCQSDEVHRTGGELIFRLPELTVLKKYDIDNIAKKTLKSVHDTEGEFLAYYAEQKDCVCQSANQEAAGPEQFFGNPDRLVLHLDSCRNFSAEKCTALFSSKDEALAAGYKACGVCKP